MRFRGLKTGKQPWLPGRSAHIHHPQTPPLARDPSPLRWGCSCRPRGRRRRSAAVRRDGWRPHRLHLDGTAGRAGSAAHGRPSTPIQILRMRGGLGGTGPALTCLLFTGGGATRRLAGENTAQSLSAQRPGRPDRHPGPSPMHQDGPQPDPGGWRVLGWGRAVQGPTPHSHPTQCPL